MNAVRGGAGAVLLGEEYVVILIRLEGRIEVDQVNGFVFDVAAEDVEVVAVVESVHGKTIEIQNSKFESES